MPAYSFYRLTAGGTVTVSTPLLDHTQTWNAGGVTFTGWKLNVTDTASASGSMLMDLQVGGSSRFNVSKLGGVTTQGDLWMANNARGVFWGAAADLVLVRDAANTLAQRNGTSAQAFNVYNTYTDGSNYERGQLLWSSNEFIVGTTATGTGTQRPMSLRGSTITLRTASTDRWTVGSGGNLTAASDNAYDFGAVGAMARNVYAGTAFIMADGVTAPSATVGVAKLYVDTSDGDLKVIFGDGTIKTLATDT